MELILTLEQGGAQTLLLEKLRYLQQQGCFVMVCAFEDGPTRPQFEAVGIPVHLIQPSRWSVVALPLFLLELSRIRRHLIDLLNRHQIDIIQSHLLSRYDFLLPGLRRAVKRLRLVIWTFHNTTFEIRQQDHLVERRKQNERVVGAQYIAPLRKTISLCNHLSIRLKMPVYRWLYRHFSRRVDAIVMVAPAVKTAMLKEFAFDERIVHVIENAISLETYSPTGDSTALRTALGIPPEAKLLLTAGRLTEQKGQRYLLEAFAQVLVAHPDVYLCIAGEGALLDDLKRLAENLKIEGRVRFLGVRQDIPALLALADIFLLPSLWEGLPQALLEAMAAAKPIIATRIPGVAGLIEDQHNGRLVPPATVNELSQAISDCLESPEACQQMGMRARETVRQKHDIVRLGQAYLHLYDRLLGT
jgi:glycosyltransferase involved in cell wall biosynthesis